MRAIRGVLLIPAGMALAGCFLAFPSSVQAGECAKYGKQVESQCLAAARRGKVTNLAAAKTLCGDSSLTAKYHCQDEFVGMGRYFEESVASKGYQYSRCQYWGWVAQQVVYWTFLAKRDGKYAGWWDKVAQPIHEFLPDIATQDCKKGL